MQGLDTSEMNGDTNSLVVFDPMYVRQKKVYSVLSSRNRRCSNVGHFDDVPVELLPDMLRTIQQYSNYHVTEIHPLKAFVMSIHFHLCMRYADIGTNH